MVLPAAELISISSDLYLLQPDITSTLFLTFSGRDAAGDISADGGDALVHIQMTSGTGILEFMHGTNSMLYP